MTKSASPVVVNREQLRAAYMFVVNNWAVSRGEVLDHLYKSGLLSHAADAVEATRSTSLINLDAKVTTAILKRLERKGLVEGTHVNQEKELTWQSYFDIENEADVPERAEAAFNDAFPVKAEKAPAAKSGATGPRYTDEQIREGHRLAVEAARSGRKVTNREIADAVGVKSPSYFAKVRREQGARLTSAAREANHSAAANEAVREDNEKVMAAEAAAAKPAKKDRTLEVTGGAFSGKAILAAAADAAKPARKWTAEVTVAGQPVPFEYGNSDTLAAVEKMAVRAAADAIHHEQGSDASVIIFKQLKGDAEPKRDRSVYVYREFTRKGEPRIGTQRQGA